MIKDLIQHYYDDENVQNPIAQISLSDALKIEDDYEIGEEVSEQVSFDQPKNNLDNYRGYTEKDVVKNILVKKIIKAYEK